MPTRHRHATAALLAVLFTLAAPGTAHAAGGVTDMSAGRFGAAVGAFLGVAGVAAGWRALVGAGRVPPVAAIAAGAAGVALGLLVVATSRGGLGTGNGLGGAYVAVLLGLAATALGARARTKRTGATTATAHPGRRR
ncbi:DUF6223 family protein [Streptomyces sp. NPDC012888]|uniref:DUF6223 family protein n=1 Tax=Streptomyces sp. NPDC012888 TaxID=3364855 RepID=UPI003698B96B